MRQLAVANTAGGDLVQRSTRPSFGSSLERRGRYEQTVGNISRFGTPVA